MKADEEEVKLSGEDGLKNKGGDQAYPGML